MNTEIINTEQSDPSANDMAGDAKIAGKSKAAGSRTRRQRGKLDPTRMQGSWVISDETKIALEGCDLFRDLDRQQIMAVAALVEEQSFQPEDYLIREDDSAHHLYIVTEGRAVAQLKMDHGWLSLGLVGPGDVAGWSSLIDSKIYPASVKALTEMKTARIEASGLRLLMNVEPAIGYPVHKKLSLIFCRQYESALRALKTAG